MKTHLRMPKSEIPTLWIGTRNGRKVCQIQWGRGNPRSFGDDYLYLAGPLSCTSALVFNGRHVWCLYLDNYTAVGRLSGYATWEQARRAAPHIKAIRERALGVADLGRAPAAARLALTRAAESL